MSDGGAGGHAPLEPHYVGGGRNCFPRADLLGDAAGTSRGESQAKIGSRGIDQREASQIIFLRDWSLGEKKNMTRVNPIRLI